MKAERYERSALHQNDLQGIEMTKTILTQEIVIELLRYNPDTGVFTWNERDKKWFKPGVRNPCKIWNTRFSGKEAGRTDGEGYIIINIFGVSLRAHRLAWIYTYGEWPDNDIDHINHKRCDNRILNLRPVDSSTNHKNRSLSPRNKSGVTGVSWNKSGERWHAWITVNRRAIHLGFFKDKEMAISKRKEAEINYGFHANHGVLLK